MPGLSFSRYIIFVQVAIMVHMHTGHTIHNHQTYPTGSPNLIKQSLQRLDYGKLTQHAAQYRQRCGISEEAQRWWMQFLVNLKETTSRCGSTVSTQWPLEELPRISHDTTDSEREPLTLRTEVCYLLISFN